MSAGLSPAAELERLAHGRCADAPPAGMSRFEIEARAPAAASAVLARTREVLAAVLRAAAGGPLADDAWPALLPSWFVEASAPEQTPEQARAWLDHLDALSPEEREAAEAAQRWSVGDFVYWFEPDQREWWWWGAESLDANRLRICLATREPSFPHEALDWLLRAAGADEVVDENVRDLEHRDGDVTP